MLIINGEVAYKKAAGCNWTTELNNLDIFYRKYIVNGGKKTEKMKEQYKEENKVLL